MEGITGSWQLAVGQVGWGCEGTNPFSMELLVFNMETMPNLRQKKQPKASLTITRHGNKLRLSAKAAEKMCLSDSSKISFGHEKGKPREWFVFEDAEHGYKLQACKGGALQTQNKALVEYFMSSLGLKNENLAILQLGEAVQRSSQAGDEVRTAYPIITAAFKA